MPDGHKVTFFTTQLSDPREPHDVLVTGEQKYAEYRRSYEWIKGQRLADWDQLDPRTRELWERFAGG